MKTSSALLALCEGIHRCFAGGISDTNGRQCGILCFLCSEPEQAVELTVGLSAI